MDWFQIYISKLGLFYLDISSLSACGGLALSDVRECACLIGKGWSLEGSWPGRVVLVTGVSPGGLGLETAKVLHLTDADAYITSRDLVKSKHTFREFPIA